MQYTIASQPTEEETASDVIFVTPTPTEPKDIVVSPNKCECGDAGFKRLTTKDGINKGKFFFKLPM